MQKAYFTNSFTKVDIGQSNVHLLLTQYSFLNDRESKHKKILKIKKHKHAVGVLLHSSSLCY